MTTQAAVFKGGEGDAWLKRNHMKLDPETDPVLGTINTLAGFPTQGNCLEIGCSNGWRLREINKRYGLNCWGADLSAKAVIQARGTKGIIDAKQVPAHKVNKYLPHNFFDVVIYGFCLYLCDREDLFSSIAAGDEVLTDGGLMIVYDFHTNFACKNPYKYKEGLWSYKQDYSKLFMANPAYSQVTEFINVAHEPPIRVTIMRKSLERGWPLCAPV